MTARYQIALLPGDSIGPEVLDAATPAGEVGRWIENRIDNR